MNHTSKAERSASGTKPLRASHRILTKLRVMMEASDMQGVEELLGQSSDPCLFAQIREQKLLLRPPRHHRSAFAELLRRASHLLDPRDRKHFDNYLTFALEVDEKRATVLDRLHASFKVIPRCSLVDLLVVADEVFTWAMSRQLRSQLSPAGISVAEYERRLHERNGAGVDLLMAVARLTNEYGRVAMGPPEGCLTRAQRRTATHLMRRAATLAGEANSLDFFFDSVTYGEFDVEQVFGGDHPTFRFHFVDARRCLLKALAIRRGLARKYAGRAHPRFLREKLKELEEPVLKEAVLGYLVRADTSKGAQIDLPKALHYSEVLLQAVDAEDDLLVAASRFDPRTIAYYVVSMVLRWYCIAAEVVRDAPQVRARAISAAPIFLDDITRRIKGIPAQSLTEAFEALTSEFPARSHVALSELPFVKDGAGVARPFLDAGTTNWACAVRKSLVQGGALGKSVGAVWENFYAQLFEGTDWKVVGRAVKLRQNGETLTDVDLLLLRDDLLLVMQIKGLIGAANTPYDHWRNRETVRVGCAQGRVAADFLLANPQTLVSVCGKHLAASVKRIQPVVLTNIDELDGWRVDDVPVIGEVTRKAICTGARVDFETNTGEILHTHHFVRPEDLTTATILRLFDETVEMRVATQGSDTAHSIHRIGGLTLEIPDFLDRPDAERFPEQDSLLDEWRKTRPGLA